MNEKQRFGFLDIIIALLAMGMVLYHLASTQYLIFVPVLHQNTHLTLALLVVFLTSLNTNKRFWPIALILIALSIVATGYVYLFHEAVETRYGFPTAIDKVIGIMMLIVVIEAARKSFGPIFPTVAIVFIAYVFLGQYLPEPFYHLPFSVDKIISYLSIGLSGGIYGSALSASANMIFLFVFFGNLLQVTGATGFFMEMGKLAGRKLRGGPAHTAVISSGFVGSVAGSVLANIAITGSFTIPMMKKAGFTRNQAGAIETAASTGAQLMPPIMGSAAFLMAEITGISYAKIIIMAVIPALLYFFSVGVYAQLQAMKLRIAPITEEVNVGLLLRRAPLFVLPLIAIIYLLMKGYTPMLAAFWSIVLMVALSFISKETRISSKTLGAWIDGCVKGTTTGCGIAVTCATVGSMVTCMTMTGAGIRIPAMVEVLSGGFLIPALMITMVASLILGCGLPTIASYVLVAIVAAPVLVKMGVGLAQAHFFALYFAVIHYITPPIGTGALVASGIAGGKYLGTAWESFKIDLGAFVLPFIWIWT